MSIRDVNHLRRGIGHDLRQREVEHLLLHALALDVVEIDALGEFPRLFAVVAQDEPKRIVTTRHASGGIDARPDQKAEVLDLEMQRRRP